MEVDRIIFGCARIMGGGERLATQRLIETALACGIRQFDTAPSYGGGHSERLLGEAIAGMVDVKVTTKVGIPRPPLDRRPRPLHAFYRKWLKPMLAQAPALKQRLVEAVAAPQQSADPLPRTLLTIQMAEAALAESESLLQHPVDTYLLHEPDRLLLEAGLAQHFADWKAAGRIRRFGWGAGSIPLNPPDFGSVQQHRYVANCLAPSERGREMVYHGVLRGTSHSGELAPARLQAALAAHPQARFIVSASTPMQIRQLVDSIT